MAKKEKGALSVKAGADAAKKVANNFKSFAFKGNIVDMAVGVVVGSAFTAIVNSLVKDLITPLLTLITGSAKYEDLFVVLKYPAGAEGASYATLAEAAEAGAVTLNYGSFLQAIINFLLIAISVFIVVSILKAADVKARKKAAAEAAKAEEAAAAAKALIKICPYCLTEIHVNAVRCPHCTSRLDAEEVPLTAPETEG